MSKIIQSKIIMKHAIDYNNIFEYKSFSKSLGGSPHRICIVFEDIGV